MRQPSFLAIIYTQQIENSLLSELFQANQQTGPATILNMGSIKGNL